MENINNTKNTFSESPFISEDNPDFQNQNNFNAFPHEGIFHPEPNIFICKTDCCYKYMGLFIILYGSISGVVMIIIGIIFKIIPLLIVGSVLLTIGPIAGIIVFRRVTIEVKFTFSHPMVEITTSSMCKTEKKFIDKKEISQIILVEIERPKGNYQTLKIKYKNGIENGYFQGPFFTKNEIDYFNNEMKNLLSYDYNSY